MRAFSILVAIGPDRPGIVKDVADFLFHHHANLEDSRMAVLGGQFALTSLFSTQSENIAHIKDDLKSLEAVGLSMSLHAADNPNTTAKQATTPLKIYVQAMDHAGIVKKVVAYLHDFSVNIESLTTDVSPAPFHGNPMFNLSILASVPPSVSTSDLQQGLKKLARKEDLDLTYPD